MLPQMDQQIIRDSFDIRRSVARRRVPPPSVVMLVDDDDLFREATTLVLEKHGYRVEPCCDALEALARLAGGVAPDVIVLDLLMPHMDGWEFRVQQQREPKWASIP